MDKHTHTPKGNLKSPTDQSWFWIVGKSCSSRREPTLAERICKLKAEILQAEILTPNFLA